MSSGNAKPIVVKVMRLVKPFYEVDNINEIENVALPGFNSMFSLPQAFGTIYLGQKFSAYVSVINRSKYEMKDMDVQVELRSQTQRYILPDEQYTYQQREDSSNLEPVQRDIGPGKNYSLIVQKPMLELGEHVISVLITYTDVSTGKRETTKKNFKFFVEKPVDIVINNIPLSLKEQLIHVSLTNTTQSFIAINEIAFQGNENVQVEEYENKSLEDENLSKVAPESLYSAVFHVKCSDPSLSALPRELGCITILWCDDQGEQGYLQTCTINSDVVDQPPIVLSYIHIPASIQLLQPLSLDFSIKNVTSNNYEITIDWTSIKKNIRILGDYYHTIHIKDHETVILPIQFLPICEGEFKMVSPKVTIKNENGESIKPAFNSTYILIQ